MTALQELINKLESFKKADIVTAGLEPKETEQEINWILIKQNNK